MWLNLKGKKPHAQVITFTYLNSSINVPIILVSHLAVSRAC